ncbi:MAG: sodium-translocating pyrophosphatase [Rhodospirillales bacterium]|jgi:K(+)-stimulated pyrophosphate-energized sodium pump|nr:sodium-translocating pyrophosphatase [Rhodospirillales bacterium]
MKASTLIVGGTLSLTAIAAHAIPAMDDVEALAQETATQAVGSIGVTPAIWWVAPIASIIGLFFAYVCYRLMMKAPCGNERMEEIAGYVREGAMAYLRQQYSRVGLVFAILFVVFSVLAFLGVQNPFVPVAFLTGGFFSGLCGYLGMKTATQASSRTAQGASESLNRGLQVAFRSGAVMGLVVVGFGLLDISIWFLILDKVVYTAEHMANGWLFLIPQGFDAGHKWMEITTTMLTFGMGASTQALFARVGGGIYTKAADVGADLVGKVEAGIPEDDPRNPATIADNVGDNVGDVAGMGADLYESYCGSILATAALGAAIPATIAFSGINAVVAPMVVAGIGIVLSILGIFAVRCNDDKASMLTLLKALRLGTWGSSALIVVACAVLAGMGVIPWGIFGAVVAGLTAGVIIGYSTEYYTSDEYTPTKGIAKNALTGPATVIIDGLATGMYSAGIPVVTTVIGILAAYGFAGGFSNPIAGLYGIGFAAVGMLATLGITLATDAYGPIADNAGGNAEMSGLPPEVRDRTDSLDMLGNTTAATGKGFAIGSAALTAMALLAAEIMEVEIWSKKLEAAHPNIDVIPGFDLIAYEAARLQGETLSYFVDIFQINLMNPLLLCGMFIGAMMAFVFCAMTMKAVGRAAGAMVDEVRRQFREKAGIMAGTEKPDYARCVQISTIGAQREMMLPSLLAITVPVVTGLILGVPGVMGLLAGGLTAGFSLACLLNNAGGAWDNAKKHIEKGNLGGKYLKNDKGEYVDSKGNVVKDRADAKNPAHGAAVIGDTVGDPCKDTAGPSLNILIKLMSMVSIVFTPVVVKFSPIVQSWLGLINQ